MFRLPATHAAGRMARRVAQEYAATRGVVGDELERLTFVVGELLDNAIDHGGGGAARSQAELGSEVEVRLELGVESERWDVVVDDQGDGDPSSLAAHLAEAADMPAPEDPRGRGLLLLKMMVDELRVEPAPERGVRVLAAMLRTQG